MWKGTIWLLHCGGGNFVWSGGRSHHVIFVYRSVFDWGNWQKNALCWWQCCPADATPRLLSETPSFILIVWVVGIHWIMALFLILGVVGIGGWCCCDSGLVFDIVNWAKVVLLGGSTSMDAFPCQPFDHCLVISWKVMTDSLVGGTDAQVSQQRYSCDVTTQNKILFIYSIIIVQKWTCSVK